MSFISGAYSAFWGGSPLGMIDRGFTLTYAKLGTKITSDQAGDTILDTIYTGVDVRIRFTLSEVDLASAQFLLWNVDQLGTAFGDAGNLGTSEFLNTQPLTLIKCGGVVFPPGQGGFTAANLITFFHTALAPDHEVNINYSPAHRKANVSLLVYPKRDEQVEASKIIYQYFEAT
jgi:hypothetical protein